MTGKNPSHKSMLEELKKMLLDTEDIVWSVPQLAAELGTTEHAIRKRIERKQIPAHKEGRSWYIFKSEYMSNLRKK